MLVIVFVLCLLFGNLFYFIFNFNPSHVTDLFLYPLKTSENQRFFRWCRKRSVLRNRLKSRKELSIYYVRKIFRKTSISYPLISLRGVRNVSFSEKLANVLNLWSATRIICTNSNWTHLRAREFSIYHLIKLYPWIL